MAITARLLCIAGTLTLLLAQIAPPVLLQVNDTRNGTARVRWSPSVGAASYLVSAEPYSFTEILPGGALTPGGTFLS